MNRASAVQARRQTSHRVSVRTSSARSDRHTPPDFTMTPRKARNSGRHQSVADTTTDAKKQDTKHAKNIAKQNTIISIDDDTEDEDGDDDLCIIEYVAKPAKRKRRGMSVDKRFARRRRFQKRKNIASVQIIELLDDDNDDDGGPGPERRVSSTKTEQTVSNGQLDTFSLSDSIADSIPVSSGSDISSLHYQEAIVDEDVPDPAPSSKDIKDDADIDIPVTNSFEPILDCPDAASPSRDINQDGTPNLLSSQDDSCDPPDMAPSSKPNTQTCEEQTISNGSLQVVSNGMEGSPSAAPDEEDYDDGISALGMSCPSDEQDPTSPQPPLEAKSGFAIKNEVKLYMESVKKYRKYGDRVLLARQGKDGLMKLGGANCIMELFPKKEDHPRFKAIGNKTAMAYNGEWQPRGPQFAGAPGGVVVYAPVAGEPFSVFMRRETQAGKQIGWEYCGEYQTEEGNEIIETYERAYDRSPQQKKSVLSSIKRSLKSKHGFWINRVRLWREKFTEKLEEDTSPAAPQWLVQRRQPSNAERKESQEPIAARLRALGYTVDASDDKVAETMVEIDEFYRGYAISFVQYDENIYNYVKKGVTTRDAQGKLHKGVRPHAMASDWYAIRDSFCK